VNRRTVPQITVLNITLLLVVGGRIAVNISGIL
jgi:hypothetical protein